MPFTYQRISAERLRAMFNSGAHIGTGGAASLRTALIHNKHLDPARSSQPFCTRSQVVAYYDPTGARVALAHQYLRPDGSLGASGKPDPKWLRVGQVIYTAR
jgi:hypothetical protein